MTLMAVIDYEKNIFGFSIYDDEKRHFIVSKDTYDSCECDVLKSILSRLNVGLLLFTLKLDNNKYDKIAEMNIKSLLIDRKSLRKVKKSFFCEKEFSISSSCYHALIIYLQKENLDFINTDYKDITMSKELKREDDIMSLLGFVAEFAIYLFEHNKYLYMTYESLKSLGIFQERNNPNLLIKSKLKHSSLFGAINHTCTSYGSEMLKNWLYFPLIDVNLIEKRRETVEFILKNELYKKLTPCLKKCRDIENIDNKFTDKKMHHFFSSLEMFLYNAREIFILVNLNIDISNLTEISNICKNNIDLKEDNMFIIKKGINKELDAQKKLYDELPEYLNEIAKKVMDEYQINLAIVYFPQLGYLIETHKFINELIPIITTENVFYYKNEFMSTLDEELGDVLNKIVDLEKDIVYSLKNKIDKYKNEISFYIEHIAKIDCLNSLAIIAKKYNLKKSKISDRIGYIEFRGLKHIFMNTPETNDVDFSIKIDGKTVITGDNGSGKSTFLKSIGNLIIINQIGSFIPCKYAELSLFDKIFTKFNSIESLKNKRSAFMSDVLQINQAFYYGTSNSLLLVDEFGKGTNIIDGVSLLFSLINNLDRFLCIYITHFQEFIENELLRDVKHYHFTKFNLREGMFNEEYSLEIFNKLKFDNDFIQKYENMKSKIKNNEINDGKRDESWAIKIINDFIMDSK